MLVIRNGSNAVKRRPSKPYVSAAMLTGERMTRSDDVASDILMARNHGVASLNVPPVVPIRANDQRARQTGSRCLRPRSALSERSGPEGWLAQR